MLYIVNSFGHFFETSSEIIPPDCSLTFSTKEDMYQHLEDQYNLQLDEVEGMQFHVNVEAMIYFDEQGNSFLIDEDSVTDFIANFQN